MTSPHHVPVIENLAAISDRYDVLFCDIWGVLHNGVRENAPAGAALEQFRKRGGRVVLVTNAPVPDVQVARILDKKFVRRASWDAIVSSGDVTRAQLIERGGEGAYHIGPDRDLSLFHDLPVDRAPIERASVAVVTGLIHEEREQAEDYRAVLERLKARRLTLICANPDRVVHVGDHLVPCAGVVADLYEEMAGKVIWAGKPYAPIYEMALNKACELSGAADKSRILMIGDSVRTDLAGANQFGVDALFVSRGVHRDHFGDEGDVSATTTALLADAGARAIGAMPALR
ncbi:TIGR01459 family HAD-type hydrolase [Terrarubrum flagellatum]|uniref:TIGR01459 family HAD-type hydrolase n=1 Tax=Terrirubrum flagellatum TaxID=2895980 RepID=UPI0031451D06